MVFYIFRFLLQSYKMLCMHIQNRLYLIDITELEDEKIFERWYSRMPAYRRDKIDSFKPARSKLLSLGAGILLDSAMNDTGIADYEISEGSKGKPYVKGRDDVFFNISHSGEWAALAVSDREVGIDIQKVNVFKESLINHVFSEEEQQLAQENGSTDMFYTRMWTMKEAVMKHSGLGISLEAKNIALKFSNGRFRPVCTEYDSGGLIISEYELEGYAISVCSSYDFSEQIKQPGHIHPG